jgi:hypothetical protein
VTHETGNTSTETREAAQIRSEAKRIHGLLYPRESFQGDGQVLTFANGCPVLSEGPQVDDL